MCLCIVYVISSLRVIVLRANNNFMMQSVFRSSFILSFTRYHSLRHEMRSLWNLG